MTHDIFISYGRDRENPDHIELVKRFKISLENEGFKVFIDEENLEIGNNWSYKLEVAISNAKYMLFFVTPYSARRPNGYCLNELAYALSSSVQVLPIMIKKETLPLSINRFQYLDLEKEKNYENILSEILSVIRGEKELNYEGEYANLLSSLNPIDFSSTIKKNLEFFTGREWINRKVEQWLENDDSKIFFITAEAGYGKSAISTHLGENNRSCCSVFFCQYDTLSTKDPKQMLKTLIYDLSTQIEEYKHYLREYNLNQEIANLDEAGIFKKLILNILHRIENDKKYFIVIDGLDEAYDENHNNKIIDLIAKYFNELPSYIKVIITSRPNPNVLRILNEFNPIELNVNDENNLNDLKQYIRNKTTNITNEQIELLLNKSEGNILYLKNILLRGKNFSIDEINNLPQGISSFYLQNFKRLFSNIDEYEEKYLNFVSLLIISKIAIHENLIKQLLNLSDRNFNKIKEVFGSLLKFDKDYVSFYHKSLYDWLSDWDKSGSYSADIEIQNDILEKLWNIYWEDKIYDSELKYEELLYNISKELKEVNKLNILNSDIFFHKKYLNLFNRQLELIDVVPKALNLEIIEKFESKIDFMLNNNSMENLFYYLVTQKKLLQFKSDKNEVLTRIKTKYTSIMDNNFETLFDIIMKEHSEYIIVIVNDINENLFFNAIQTLYFAEINKKLPIFLLNYNIYKDDINKYFEIKVLPNLMYIRGNEILANLPVFDYTILSNEN